MGINNFSLLRDNQFAALGFDADILKDDNQPLDFILKSIADFSLRVNSEGKILKIIQPQINLVLKDKTFQELIGVDEYLRNEIAYKILFAIKWLRSSQDSPEYFTHFKVSEIIYSLRVIKISDSEFACIGTVTETDSKSAKNFNLLKLALELSTNACIITDIEGNIIWSNNSFTEISGYTKDEVKGKNPRLLKSGLHEKQFYTEMWQTILSGSAWQGIIYNKRKNGEIYLDKQSITPIFNSQNQIVNFIALKEKFIGEKELEEEIEQFSKLLEMLSDTVIFTDPDFRIISWDDKTQSIYGFKSHEVKYHHIAYILNSKNEYNFNEKTLKKLSTSNKHVFNDVHVFKNGEKIYVESTVSGVFNRRNELIGYATLHRDISNQIILEDELKTKEDLIKSFFHSSGDLLFVWDKKFNFLLYNDTVFELFKEFPENLTDKNLGDFINHYPDVVNKFKKMIRAVFEFGGSPNFESVYIIKDNVIIGDSYFFPLKDTREEIYAVGLILKDITDQKKNEEKIIEDRKLTLIGKMAAYITHEMKTPLNSIKMNIDLLKESLILTDTHEKSFNIIQKETNRLSKLLQNVLQFSRVRPTVYKDINLYDIIESIKTLLEPYLNKKRIILLNEIHNITIWGNARELESIFIHLIENSIDAIEEDGEIKLWSVHEPENSYFKVYIQDNGCGIKEESNIFEPFYTTKNTGTGLGLAIVLNMLKNHNAEISLISSKPEQTVFEIKFRLQKNG